MPAFADLAPSTRWVLEKALGSPPRYVIWRDDWEIWERVLDSLSGPQWLLVERLAGYDRPKLSIVEAAIELGLPLPRARRLADDALLILRRPPLFKDMHRSASTGHERREVELARPSHPRCTASTTSGKVCRNPAARGTRLCEQHRQATFLPCQAHRRDGAPCGNVKLDGYPFCYAHFGTDRPVWSDGAAGEAMLRSVPRIPPDVSSLLPFTEESTSIRGRERIRRRYERLSDRSDAQAASDLIREMVDSRFFSLAIEAITALEPSPFWTATTISRFFRSTSYWRHVSAGFFARTSQQVFDSPEDSHGTRSRALGHLGTYALANGQPATSRRLWSAAGNVRELDEVLSSFARDVTWTLFVVDLRTWRGERRFVDHIARIIRTVDVREALLRRYEFRPAAVATAR